MRRVRYNVWLIGGPFLGTGRYDTTGYFAHTRNHVLICPPQKEAHASSCHWVLLSIRLFLPCCRKTSEHKDQDTMTAVGTPRDFKIAFSDETLQKLQDRLNDTELPTEEIVPNASWDYGTDLTKLSQMVKDWKDGSPLNSRGEPLSSPQGVVAWWRGVEERLNKCVQHSFCWEYVQTGNLMTLPLFFPQISALHRRD
jgi:hypothetical protein